MTWKKRRVSGSAVTTLLVVGVVTLSLSTGLLIFMAAYRRNVMQSAAVSSQQAVAQVSNIIGNFTADLNNALGRVESLFVRESPTRDADLNALIVMRSDVVAVTSYYPGDDGSEGNSHGNDTSGAYCPGEGRPEEAWTGSWQRKEEPLANLSYSAANQPEKGEILVSKPHVESLLVNFYPWVVSVSKRMRTPEGEERIVVMDIRFSQIASYVDNVGIGSHGYCFIVDGEGNMIYHPQQQLIYAGLKEEMAAGMVRRPDGTYQEDGMICQIQTRQDSGWRIVGVSYVDEMITRPVRSVALILSGLLIVVTAAAFAASTLLSRLITRPGRELASAMREFEKNAEGFTYHPVDGSQEIADLSDSFGHMVLRIQELMDKVRGEEITLRKTELRALQAQINPHFLYNTLDSIAWMCEDGRTREAVEMVNSLARLFRISISKGHELIPIEKEVEHAESYLKIQNFRYKNQFTYSFQVEEACRGYYCNKITLQPIIENAIYHGLNRMIDEGRILIRIYERQGSVYFVVEDNGVGMTPEQCRNILHREPGDNRGIGIKNVHDRIRIYFGEEYGLTVESELDVGTKVIIRMPVITDGEKNNYEERQSH